MLKQVRTVLSVAGLILMVGVGIQFELSRPAFAIIGDQFGLSPFWDWKTLETDHFRVSFPKELEEVAQKAANHLEEAHSVLSPRLHWQPKFRTQVLVVDNADLANGLTSPLARLGLILFATPPDPFFSTAYYDDWLRLLVFHEYTHFLNMDATDDFYKVLRYLFGDVILPNAAWPTWMLEGLAVYMETRFTRLGRGRSPYYEMILRSAVSEGVLDDERFITLDKINGFNPYSPAGETAYLFGYQLMNQVAQGQPQGEAALGTMSIRSASRIPFFINGNLENITGKTWKKFWQDWVSATRTRQGEALKTIATQPLTQVEPLTQINAISSLGAAPSPDGHLLAYTTETPDRRGSLNLLKLATGEVQVIDDKLMGASESFTPDSKAIIYSSIHRKNEYYLWSDLAVYDLERDSTYFVTEDLRARDPDISRDGRWVAFTVTDQAATDLAVAPLLRDGHGKYSVGTLQKLGVAQRYDRVSTPKFSAEGKRIYFALHRNGRTSEELLEWDIENRKSSEVVSDGHFNRNPAVAPSGETYFISDATGVDNLYRLSRDKGGKPTLISNVVSGLAFPAIGPEGTIYASHYSSRGWTIARVKPIDVPIDSARVTVAPPPAPLPDRLSDDHSERRHYEVKDYNVIPSIWPRQWLLLPELYTGGVYIQTEVAGFDAVDRHNYALGLGYNTGIPQVDWLALYSNRSLGPTLTIEGDSRTTHFALNDQGVTDYTRKTEYSARFSFPILGTYDSLVPTLGMNAERSYDYLAGSKALTGDSVNSSAYVPSADFSLAFINTETAPLSIGPEKGRSSVIGARIYSDSGNVIWKGVFKESEYLRLADHVVFNPSFKALWTSSYDSGFGPANAVIEGRSPELLTTPLSGVFSSVGIRGYPQNIYYSRSVAIAAIDFRFPLLRIFRGWETNPLFVDNLYGVAFTEATYFPGAATGVSVLPSAGGGIRVTTEVLLHLPLTLAFELHQGFRAEVGGKQDLFLQLQLGALPF